MQGYRVVPLLAFNTVRVVGEGERKRRDMKLTFGELRYSTSASNLSLLLV